MANEFKVKRVAFENFTVPTSLTATASVGTGIYIPAGAIVTGIKAFAGGAVTLAAASNATVLPIVGTSNSTVALATNNRVASAAIVQTAVKSVGVAAADGIYVPYGGYVTVNFGSTGTAATGIVADADLYVEYLYVVDNDA